MAALAPAVRSKARGPQAHRCVSGSLETNLSSSMRPSHLLSLSLAGCATVTQQDPPSQLDPAGVRTNLPANSGGGGGTAPLAELPALVGSSPAGPPAPSDINPGTRTPPVAEVSNGGSPGTALPDVDAGP